METESSAHWLCPDETGYLGQICPRRESGFRLTVYAPDFQTPAWFRRSIMYQIFPDRFAFSNDDTAEKGIAYHVSLGQSPELHKSLDEPVRYLPRSFEQFYHPDDFYGGTLRGIREKLPYLKELGISCLYLNPIVEARSNHRYDTSDYLKVDPILGDTEDFRDLCRAAGEYGIRILCDGVFSHTGADSIYFNRDGHYPGDGACQNQQGTFGCHDGLELPIVETGEFSAHDGLSRGDISLFKVVSHAADCNTFPGRIQALRIVKSPLSCHLDRQRV